MAKRLMHFLLSRGEMIPDQRDVEAIDPKKIDDGGALGLWDGFGQASVIVDGERVMTLSVYRDGKDVMLAAKGLDGSVAKSKIG